ncbi:MAG: SRPBCC family protein [Microthrixaceae bacterium]
MELTNTFNVSAPIDEVWRSLIDLRVIAAGTPGAEITEVDGDEHRGTLTLDLGPDTVTYRGKARVIESDEAAKRAVIEATGDRTTGEGTAMALVTARLSEPEDGTDVELTTDLTLTGEVAQLARGVLAEASATIIGQVIENLEAARVSAPDAATVSTAPTGTGPGAGQRPAGLAPSPESDAADLLEAGGVPLAKKLLPALGVVALILLIIGVLRSRSK